MKDSDALSESGEAESGIILSVAEFPSLVIRVVKEISGAARNPLLVERAKAEKPHWVRKFPAREDDGFLLFSGVDPDVKHSAVKLIRISDGKVMALWAPDWDAIYSKLTEKKWERTGRSNRGIAYHPVLLDNGDIIFNIRTGMVRASLCDRKPVWVIDKVIHHSNELALDGKSIWSPSIAEGYFSANPLLNERLRDDSLARISFDGEVLENISVSKILIENGLQGLLLGTGGHQFQEDPIHLNHISVASADSKYWKRGDLLLTARTPSAVFLYRPSTGKIVWHRTGPWMNQHSARFVDDHRISILDNNVVSGAPKSQPFALPGQVNRLLVYDFETDEITEPYAKLLEQAKPVTWTQGLAKILPDGGLFVEETNFGRHLRFTKDKLLWSRVNDYDKNNIGIVARSRYLSPQQVEKPLAAIAARQCDANRGGIKPMVKGSPKTAPSA
ncbi:MAG TPA: arylsulfotransferase family protein [Burkholderiales bacterium]|nr:arylsulfotransferase family protein [Burkholderiales bacterium]